MGKEKMKMIQMRFLIILMTLFAISCSVKNPKKDDDVGADQNKREIKVDTSITYHSNGNIDTKSLSVNGKFHGPQEFYLKDGNLECIDYYYKGLFHTKFIYTGGKILREERNYKTSQNGEDIVDEIKVFDSNGKIDSGKTHFIDCSAEWISEDKIEFIFTPIAKYDYLRVIDLYCNDTVRIDFKESFNIVKDQHKCAFQNNSIEFLIHPVVIDNDSVKHWKPIRKTVIWEDNKSEFKIW